MEDVENLWFGWEVQMLLMISCDCHVHIMMSCSFLGGRSHAPQQTLKANREMLKDYGWGRTSFLCVSCSLFAKDPEYCKLHRTILKCYIYIKL